MENESGTIKISETGYFLATLLRGPCVTRFYANDRDLLDDEILYFARCTGDASTRRDGERACAYLC